jgi:hypothetical protein
MALTKDHRVDAALIGADDQQHFLRGEYEVYGTIREDVQ